MDNWIWLSIGMYFNQRQHKSDTQDGAFIIFQNFLSSDCRNSNEISTILKG